MKHRQTLWHSPWRLPPRLQLQQVRLTALNIAQLFLCFYEHFFFKCDFSFFFFQPIRCRFIHKQTGEVVWWCTCRGIHRTAPAHTSKVPIFPAHFWLHPGPFVVLINSSNCFVFLKFPVTLQLPAWCATLKAVPRFQVLRCKKVQNSSLTHESPEGEVYASPLCGTVS